ncbi:MAG: TonB-dependent receptor domain-containing protein [Blastocatellia bacterium]
MRLPRPGRPFPPVLAWLLCLCAMAMAQRGVSVSGAVRDSHGAGIAGATVHLLTPRQAIAATAITGAGGEFTLTDISPGAYEALVTGPRGFAGARTAVHIGGADESPLHITIGAGPVTEEVTITAESGAVQALGQTTQPVNVIGQDKLEMRAKSVTAQIAQEEPGLQLQRTSPGIGAIFVRGLTGAKVANYVDGIRFSTAAARGGINTFFNLNDVTSLRAVEVVRGPNSAQLGSDSIGGSVQLITRAPLLTSGARETHGQISQHYNSADHGFGGNVLLTTGSRNLAILVNLSAHRSNTVRPGGGFESHSAINRFLGLRSDLLLGARSTDTAFTQYGGMFKLTHRLTGHDQLSLHYQRGQLDGSKRFDQTIGGDGNLIADLRNFMLDFFYGRYERFGAGGFDTLSLSYSYNAQREERVNQGGNGNPQGAITRQPERTLAQGVQAQAARQWTRHLLVIGGEFYHDRVRAPSYTLDPATQAVAQARPRVPDRATWRNTGLYAQNTLTIIPERLRLIAALRYSRGAYRSLAANSPLVNGRPLWPDDRLTANALTPRIGVALTLGAGLTLTAQASRGFRAPHITDLGTLGLTGNGFEANAADLAGRGATLGTTAAASAVSTNIPVAQLKPETSWTYEGGLSLRRSRVDASVNGFVNNLNGNIVLQTLILPAGAVGLTLGDQRVTTQSAGGAVFVPAATNPVLIRSNYGDARIYGIEQKVEAQLSQSITLGQNFTWLRAEDKQTGAPPTIEGGTPAPQGNIRVRYATPGGRFWIEPYLYAARRQTRLSTLDLEDRRTGATRTRASIQNFFRRGATVRGLVAAGLDGRFGTADDTLIATGETLAQVQNRVLGAANGAPLFRYIPGFVTFGVRGGFRFNERQDITADLENLNDKNYRGISWGMDAPGRGVSVRYRYRF